jgi:hypothetical protein
MYHKSLKGDSEEETTVPNQDGSAYNIYTYCSMI